MATHINELIYDWNMKGRVRAYPPEVEINDETLRDGLQSAFVTEPPIEGKLRLLHLMHDLGIRGANLGYAGTRSRTKQDIVLMAKEIVSQKLNIHPQCAARTDKVDIDPIADVSQRAGLSVEVGAFIASSPIRRAIEQWDLNEMCRRIERVIKYALAKDLTVMLVTEDTTRSDPQTLERLYTTAIHSGANRICVADTVGHATPEGVACLLAHVQTIIAKTGEHVKIDWHGHQDRGLSVINCLTAISSGVDRVHATALGVGERCGNVPMEILLMNLKLLGMLSHDLTQLPEYTRLVSESLSVDVPHTCPVVGEGAFLTVTGVHADAIRKGWLQGGELLANRVYSGVPANLFGLQQRNGVGPMSGKANVEWWLEEHGIPAGEDLVKGILHRVKEEFNRVLTDAEMSAIVKTERKRGSPPPAPTT